jgi:polygalacturonase
MTIDRRALLAAATVLPLSGATGRLTAAPVGADRVDVRRFGARGDGATIDTPAFNRAIDHAAARGGGTVFVPAGRYACYTIRLRSKVTLHLDAGAVILAAAPSGTTGYDEAEPNPAGRDYQDSGHSHWRNSLIWGEGLTDIAITGQGLIWGKGLGRGDGKDDWLKDPSGPGTGNKAIALKNCRNVLLRDFRMLEGGWFAILATGVDNLVIDNLLIDTNRDGMDIDCCRNVRISRCTVNSPWDDGIWPKSSYALGEPRITENLTISDCFVTGNYEVGSVLDGSWRRMPAAFAPRIHGRIKFGTESNGGFRNIAITNCIFQESRGLAFETVDGAMIEDVVVGNITMRGIVDAPLFIRLGRRMRGPAGRPVGSIRRIAIHDLVSSGANLLPSVIAGLADHPIEDIRITDSVFHHIGGAPAAMAALAPPENALGYPEATMFGDLPATGLFARHVRGLTLGRCEIAVATPDPRPAIRLEDVGRVDVTGLHAPMDVPAFALDRVRDFRSVDAWHRRDRIAEGPLTERF